MDPLSRTQRAARPRRAVKAQRARAVPPVRPVASSVKRQPMNVHRTSPERDFSAIRVALGILVVVVITMMVLSR